MRRHLHLNAFALVLCTLTLAATVRAEDWPQWRGPNHDGISSAKDLVTKWDAKPPVVWEREIGSAFSAVTCVGDKVYTCGTRDKQQTLLCLAAADGRIVWQQPFEKEYRDRQGGDGTRATPTVNDGKVYIHTPRGRMICFDATDGQELWSRQFNAKPQWGYSGSVLIEGGLAVIVAGADDGGLIAVDKETGKTKWKTSPTKISYATPYPFTYKDRRYIVGFLAKSAIIVEAKTGREVCDIPWETSWDVNAATPIYHDGHLFLSSGYKHGAILLRLSRKGNKLGAETAWQNTSIRAKFQTPVLYEGHLYTSDEVGLKCIEFATGTEKWSRPRMKHGTVVIAEGNLFVLTEGGKLLIGPVTPTSFEPQTEVEILGGRCWTVPTLCNGRLYARNFDRVTCLKLAR